MPFTIARLFDHRVTYRVRYAQADMGGNTQGGGLFVQNIKIEEASL